MHQLRSQRRVAGVLRPDLLHRAVERVLAQGARECAVDVLLAWIDEPALGHAVRLDLSREQILTKRGVGARHQHVGIGQLIGAMSVVGAEYGNGMGEIADRIAVDADRVAVGRRERIRELGDAFGR